MNGFQPSAGEVTSTVATALKTLADILAHKRGFQKNGAIHDYLTALERAYPTSHVKQSELEHDENFRIKRQEYIRVLEFIEKNPSKIANFSTNLVAALQKHPCQELIEIFTVMETKQPRAFDTISFCLAAKDSEMQPYAHRMAKAKPSLLNARKTKAGPTVADDILAHIARKGEDKLSAYRSGVLGDIRDFKPKAITERGFADFIQIVKDKYGTEPSPGLMGYLRIAVEDIIPMRKKEFRAVWLKNIPIEWDTMLPCGRDRRRLRANLNVEAPLAPTRPETEAATAEPKGRAPV